MRCLGHLAHALMLTADVDRSREVAARAWAILEQVTAPPGLTFLHGGHAYVATAEVWLAMGDAERAEQALTPLLEAGEAAGWLEVIATASFALGRARMAVGDGDGADQRLTRALEVAEGSGLASVEWRTHASAAVLRRAQGRTDEAEGHLSRSHAVIDRTAAGIMDAKLRRAFRHGARAALSG